MWARGWAGLSGMQHNPALNPFLKFLLRIWRVLPDWVHVLGTLLVRPRYRVGVVAVVFDDQGRILLFKHTYRRFDWGLPAGGLEPGEAPEQAVIREFREETGIPIEVKRMLMAVSARQGRHISLVYLCRISGGEFRESLEISAMKYFEPAHLPAMLFSEKEMIRMVLGQLQRESQNELA